MERFTDTTIKISVRNLVEFILRSGDLDDRGMGSGPDLEAMQQGSRIHRKIQRQQGSGYQAEVPLSLTVPVTRDGDTFSVCVEGRADGIIAQEGGGYLVDEIKAMYMDIDLLKEPVPVHRAQAMCYAYLYGQEKRPGRKAGNRKAKKSAEKDGNRNRKIRLTYCQIETESIRYFEEAFTGAELEQWFHALLEEYGKWAHWQFSWNQLRDQSIKGLEFPFPYRSGQRDLAAGVYRTILRGKKLYIEAPTGVGKTISTLYPAVKAMGEGIASKIFYLTAKTITRTVAEEAFSLLAQKGAVLKTVSLTAKEKICILDKPDCNPAACPRAKGHYDRVNDAVYELLTEKNQIGREEIEAFAQKHNVCPFELCLDTTNWVDGVICDYNYAFDPTVYLKRFFGDEKKNDYIFLIDEAHNLVERAREMYSASLIKEQFLEVRRLVKGRSKKLEDRLSACNTSLLALKRQCDGFRELERIEDLVLGLLRLMEEYEEFFRGVQEMDGKEEILSLYFNVRQFLFIYEVLSDKYVIYTDYTENQEFRIRLQCMDPSDNLKLCLKRGRSAIFFSATLLPIRYYKEQLAGEEEDYAVYAPSPFGQEQRLLMVGRDVSTRYDKRSQSEYEKIAGYIISFVKAKRGNYMVFFPSYQMLDQLAVKVEAKIQAMDQKEEMGEIQWMLQKSNMTETEREQFLNAFQEEPMVSHVGFCVMGGIFGEGIDLKADRLIGAIIVGTGLPMVCEERELFRRYYEEKKGSGFHYAYLYNGMNKVLQSAGRVIRTDKDKGAVLLLDERFSLPAYQELFPREWFPHMSVNRKSMERLLADFWEEE